MKNIELLMNYNDEYTYDTLRMEDKRIIFRLEDEQFNYSTLKKIIIFCNSVHRKYKGINVPIVFQLNNIKIVNKLIYIIFECICECLISEWRHDVWVTFKNDNHIWSEGILSSPLLLLETGKKKHLEKFQQRFNFDIYKRHFRKLVKGNEQADSDFLCKLASDIDSFLKAFSVREEYRDAISEVAVELIGNAGEHTGSDCLIDIDVSKEYIKIANGQNYYGINIAIINYADKLLGDGIKEKIESQELLDDRHEKVKKAYIIHKNEFNEDYTEQDFYSVASFQHRISEREEVYTGGTGLTKLIQSLESKADMHMCYVLSGRRGLMFKKEYLEYNDGRWIGFNKENDFLTQIPDVEIFDECDIFFPGTAYNLNFVMAVDEAQIDVF